MQKIILFLLISFCASSFLVGQNLEKDVLLTIDGQKVTRAEFERIYTKNNQEAAFDSASLNEYMRLFVNFKLKVFEAEALGMDTLESFVKELNGYKVQLEKPYFTDNSADEALIKEAYDRMKVLVRASHILVRCDENALPADTLKAYNKLNSVRKRVLKGEDFSKLAGEYSDDGSAKSNGGDLGYFAAFSMVYEFESVAYNTPVGEISDIFRTKFGYHFLKVTGHKKDPGRVQVAHIMRAVPKGSSIEKENEEQLKINAIYDSIMGGASFEQMAYEYSDDKGTSKKGGALPYFNMGRMVPEFETAAFALENFGDVSKPVRTSFGFHIIKLLDRDTLGSIEEMSPIIKNKISKDIRAQRGKEMVYERLLKEYNVLTNNKALIPFFSVVDSTIFIGGWDINKAAGLNETLVTIADTLIYTQHDFAVYLANLKLRQKNKPIEILVSDEFNKYLENAVTDFEKSRLETKYPDFKNLVEEYHDGILLFNLTDKMVWSKAIEDTVGLEQFYEKNKNNYMWGDRVEATLYTFNNKELEKKISSLALKIAKKNLNFDVEKSKFVAKESAADTSFRLEISKNKYSKGENDIIDAVSWEPGIKEVQQRDSLYVIVYVNNIVTPEPKLLNEARGLITADYQNFLEEIWLNELREKYKVVINEELFSSMVK